jgi:hypothetical protein
MGLKTARYNDEPTRVRFEAIQYLGSLKLAAPEHNGYSMVSVGNEIA